jgi:heat shock protein HslJ
MRDPTISFEDGTALVDAGCNTGSVRYTTSGDQITFDGLDLTENSCDGVAESVERQFVQALAGTATVELDNGILILVVDGQRLVFFPD